MTISPWLREFAAGCPGGSRPGDLWRTGLGRHRSLETLRCRPRRGYSDAPDASSRQTRRVQGLRRSQPGGVCAGALDVKTKELIVAYVADPTGVMLPYKFQNEPEART